MIVHDSGGLNIASCYMVVEGWDAARDGWQRWSRHQTKEAAKLEVEKHLKNEPWKSFKFKIIKITSSVVESYNRPMVKD